MTIISTHITFSNDFIPFFTRNLQNWKVEKLKKRNPGLSVFPPPSPSKNTPAGVWIVFTPVSSDRPEREKYAATIFHDSIFSVFQDLVLYFVKNNATLAQSNKPSFYFSKVRQNNLKYVFKISVNINLDKSILYINEIKSFLLWIYDIFKTFYVRSNNLGLKYQRCTQSGSKDFIRIFLIHFWARNSLKELSFDGFVVELKTTFVQRF